MFVLPAPIFIFLFPFGPLLFFLSCINTYKKYMYISISTYLCIIIIITEHTSPHLTHEIKRKEKKRNKTNISPLLLPLPPILDRRRRRLLLLRPLQTQNQKLPHPLAPNPRNHLCRTPQPNDHQNHLSLPRHARISQSHADVSRRSHCCHV